MDFDEYDSVMDHLIVRDASLPEDEQIVGTYRMMRREVADKFGKFYTDSEFDIKPLLTSGAPSGAGAFLCAGPVPHPSRSSKTLGGNCALRGRAQYRPDVRLRL